MVKNRKMKITYFKPSLIVAFNRFDHVNRIQVVAKKVDYENQVKEEIETIRANLPRNRCVQLNFSVEIVSGFSCLFDSETEESESGDDDN